MLKNSHAADAAMLSELPLATSFVTSIFLGRGEYARHESAGLVAARTIADQMAAHYQNGRKALVYAQLPSGRQFLVPDSYQPQKETTMKTYSKKFNAKRAAESLTKKFPSYTVADPVAADAAGEWYPALMAPKSLIAAGVPAEVSLVAYINGADLGSDGTKPEPIEPAAKAVAKPKATRKSDNATLTPPDFSAKTHTRFRPKLAAVVSMVEARDIDGLRKFHINPSSTSPRAIMRYRDRALVALTE